MRDWKNTEDYGFLSSTHLELCVSVFGYSGESLRFGYADKLYGDYASVEDVIQRSILERVERSFLWTRPLLFLVP